MSDGILLPDWAGQLRARLRTTCVGGDIRAYASVGSTNDVAKAGGEAGWGEGTVVIAREQTPTMRARWLREARRGGARSRGRSR